MNRSNKVVVVSNRLPITVSVGEHEVRAYPSSGGLVSALSPIMETLPSKWIGWPGTEHTPAVERCVANHHSKYEIVPVYLSGTEKQKYYDGFSNQILWPLCHDLLDLCNFDVSFWPAYKRVNQKFAEVVTANSTSGDLVWVHDCHLMLVAGFLGNARLRRRLVYFHHIPFPSPDMFANLPSGREILRALLQYDSMGFQTQRDRRNFIDCVRAAFGRQVRTHFGRPDLFIEFEGNRTYLKTSAVSIDVSTFQSLATSSGVKTRIEALNAKLGNKQVILGVDRLDYTKGIQLRLASYRLLLERHPELHGTVVFLQLVVPSREHVPEYEALRSVIEREVGQINGSFGQPDWTPVIYMHRNIPREELVAWYQLASVMLVTSRKDGMNLVAKEYCTCNLNRAGALVLSKFAGAAEELGLGAFLVNPNDREEIADACFCALNTNHLELRRRMSTMQETIRNHDALRWFAVALEEVEEECLPEMVRLNGTDTTEVVA